MGAEDINKYLVIGILIILLVFALAVIEIKNNQNTLAETSANINGTNSDLVGEFNNTNKTPPGPVSIPLEKPPFID